MINFIKILLHNRFYKSHKNYCSRKSCIYMGIMSKDMIFCEKCSYRILD